MNRSYKTERGILDLKKKTETERGKQLIIQNQKTYKEEKANYILYI